MSFFTKIEGGLKTAGKDVAKVAIPAAVVALPIFAGPAGSVAAQGLKLLEGSNNLNTNKWMQYLLRALAAAPLLVAGIEQIHGDTMKGADKKQLVMESLGLASAVAPAI